MEGILVKGGRRLEGIINISGAKNAALPIMAASLLPHRGKTRLLNVPMVDDIQSLGRALVRLGFHVDLSENCALIDNSNVNNHIMPLKESKEFRASVLVAGPLLAGFG